MSNFQWQDERDRYGNVRAVFAEIGKDSDFLRIDVHHHIDHGPDVWLYSCFGMGVDRKQLVSRDLESAKSEALEKMIVYLFRTLNALKELAGKP